MLRRSIIPLANRYRIGFFVYCDVAAVSALSEWVSFLVALLANWAECCSDLGLFCRHDDQFAAFALDRLPVGAAAAHRGHARHCNEYARFRGEFSLLHRPLPLCGCQRVGRQGKRAPSSALASTISCDSSSCSLLFPCIDPYQSSWRLHPRSDRGETTA